VIHANGAKIPSKTVQGTIREGGKTLFDSIDIEVFSSSVLPLQEHNGLQGMFLLPAQRFLVPGFYDLDLKAGVVYRIMVKELRAKGRKDIYALFGEVPEAQKSPREKPLDDPMKARHPERHGWK
jgi:hypothetical protein